MYVYMCICMYVCVCPYYSSLPYYWSLKIIVIGQIFYKIQGKRTVNKIEMTEIDEMRKAYGFKSFEE